MNPKAPDEDLEYCRQQVKALSYPEYLSALHALPVHRPALLALLALDIELRQVRMKAPEEMLTHIRFAWWREALEAWRAKQIPREHPVIKSLNAHLSPGDEILEAEINRMVDFYQENEADNSSELACSPCVDAISHFIAADCNTVTRYDNARQLAEKHVARHGSAKKPLLALKMFLNPRFY